MTAPENPQNTAVAEVADLLPLVLEGLADTDQFNRLNVLLRDHAGARLYYLQYMELHAELGGQSDMLVAAEIIDTIPDVFREVIDDALEARRLHDLELQAQAQLKQNLRREREKQQVVIATHDRGKLQIVIPIWAVIGSSAAAAALILLAILPFLQSDAPQLPQVVQQNVTPQNVPAGVEIDPIVATLTATRDAQWDQADLVTDDRLMAGQRLSLIAGFAEITTSRGAVAILEAPVTVELIDSPNAIRLISGKLIGLCETESSKGFLVRTPHMDVTDLGTRFGVDLSHLDATEVHVLSGEVEVTSVYAPDGHAPQRLLANEAVRARSDQASLIPITPDPSRFAAMALDPVQLPGTGNRLKAGETEPNWQIVEINGSKLADPQSVRVLNEFKHQRDVPNDPGISQWIGYEPPSRQTWGKTTSFLFRTQLNIADVCDLDTTEIMLRYIADNRLKSIRVNGHKIEVNHPVDTSAWKARPLTLREHLVHGENVIDFEVICTGGFVALNMQWELDSGTDQ